LKAGQDAFQVMRATFPAGTVSGSPKVRALQILAESEPTRRGGICGCGRLFFVRWKSGFLHFDSDDFTQGGESTCSSWGRVGGGLNARGGVSGKREQGESGVGGSGGGEDLGVELVYVAGHR
jgi:hypothetical protein